MIEHRKIIAISLIVLLAFTVLRAEDLPQFGITIAKQGLILRENPDVESKALALIPYGSKVNLIDRGQRRETIGVRKSAWYLIESEGNRGWVFGGFLATQPSLVNDPAGLNVLFMARSLIDQYEYSGTWSAPGISKQSNFTFATAIMEIEPDAQDVYREIMYVFYTGGKEPVHLENSPIENSDGSIKIMRINQDSYPDFLVQSACCSNNAIRVYLGGRDSLVETFSANELDTDLALLSVGQCEKLQIRHKDQRLAFDCKKNEFKPMPE
ncbi:MAG: SH3 domain-containing protein [bacterium]|nr:SH3 domain-containing protein [bacterium]